MGVILKALYHYIHTYIFLYELQSQRGRKLFQGSRNEIDK